MPVKTSMISVCCFMKSRSTCKRYSKPTGQFSEFIKFLFFAPQFLKIPKQNKNYWRNVLGFSFEGCSLLQNPQDWHSLYRLAILQRYHTRLILVRRGCHQKLANLISGGSPERGFFIIWQCFGPENPVFEHFGSLLPARTVTVKYEKMYKIVKQSHNYYYYGQTDLKQNFQSSLKLNLKKPWMTPSQKMMVLSRQITIM